MAANGCDNMSDWISFYDFKHSVIYVNARHRDVHYRTIAEDIRELVPSPTAQRARLWLRRGDLAPIWSPRPAAN